MELTEKLYDSTSPIIEQQERLQRIIDTATIPKIAISSPAIDTLKEITDFSTAKVLQDNDATIRALTGNDRTLQTLSGVGSAIETLRNSRLIHTMDELAIRSAIPNYQFEIPLLKVIDVWNHSSVTDLASGLTALVTNPVMQEMQTITSSLGKWLLTVDYSPLTTILERIRPVGFDHDYGEVNRVFLNAMYNAKWFPYAGWIADIELFAEVNHILSTSHSVKNHMSKRCEKRIDKAILSYYTKEEIKRLKYQWKESALESHIKKALGQTLEAYLRKEYALVIPFLATMWEGIIKSKTKVNTKQLKEDFKKLVDENGFDEVFSDFYNNMIISTCYSVDDVVEGVPNRHGVAHSWYPKYPSQKAALNAILLTDFLINLEPIDREEIANGN